MFLSLKKNSAFFFGLIFLTLVALAYVHGWKSSGVLENTKSWLYPEGYAYSFTSPKYGLWWINKESAYYLHGAQGFLAVPDTTLHVGRGYDVFRSLYSLLLKTFWCLEPIEAVLLLDIFLWLAACVAIWQTVKNLNLGPSMGYFSVFFTLLGQGFLQSVGEGMPHIAGYVSGYFIVFLISFFKTWQKQTSIKDDALVYIFIGIWQLVYGTALFFLLLAVMSTLIRLKQDSFRNLIHLPLLSLLAIFPYAILSLIMPSVGVGSVVLNLMIASKMSVMDVFGKYCEVLIDSFISLGPISLLGLGGLIYGSLKNKNYYLKVGMITCIVQFMGMALSLVPLSGRGYATFNFYIFLCLGGAFLFSQFWESEPKIYKVLIIILCFGQFSYVNGRLFGIDLPDKVFFSGVFRNINSPWKADYEIRFFQ